MLVVVVGKERVNVEEIRVQVVDLVLSEHLSSCCGLVRRRGCVQLLPERQEEPG